MGISQYRLARSLGVPVQRIHALVHGRRAMTADTALRLARFFAMEAQFWMNPETRYDLERAADTLAGRLEREVEPYARLGRGRGSRPSRGVDLRRRCA